MSEFIIIQVGQCGNQIGSYLLPEILNEYDIKTTQNKPKPARNDIDHNHNYNSFFNFRKKSDMKFETLGDLVASKAKARFICIDMEDSVVARLKTGTYCQLYDKKNLLTNYPGSGNNWAEGFYHHGSKYKEKIIKILRYNVEQCDNLNGFVLLFSMGGGTGSGLGTFIVQLLAELYPNIERFVICVYPIGTEDVITCPYNMAFATEKLLDYATCVFPVENRSLMEMIKKQFRPTDKYPFEPFEDLNKLIVDLILNLTSGARFRGKLNIDMNDINTNMIPFPQLNFLSCGFSPIVVKYATQNRNNLKNELFLTACSRSNQMVKVDPLNPKSTTMSLSLLARGNYSLNEMRLYVDKLKNRLNFPPWSRQPIRVGLCNVAPRNLEFSMFSMSNTTSMCRLFEEISCQFTKLYQRKAHVHHYTAISEFELEHFKICQNSLNAIIHFYQDIEKNNC